MLSVAAGAAQTSGCLVHDLADPLDFQALAPGVSWWYNWGSQPNKAVPADYVAQYGLDYYPMLWNGTYDAPTVESFLHANPNIEYLLVMNEPNLTSQSNLTPSQAAASDVSCRWNTDSPANSTGSRTAASSHAGQSS